MLIRLSIPPSILTIKANLMSMIIAPSDRYTIRAATIHDLPPVVALMNACSLKVIGKSDDTIEDIGSDWAAPGFDQARNQRVALSPDGQVIGFAHVDDERPIAPFLDVYAHPDFQNSGSSLDAALMAWGEARARECIALAPAEARVIVRAATYQQDHWYSALLQNAGMLCTRHFWRMQIDLDEPPAVPTWPDGINVRPAQPDEDLRAVLHAQRAAMQDHWGSSERSFEEHFEHWWHEWQSDFDLSLWFLAMDGDRITGISLCRYKEEDNGPIGWVNTLAVRREYRQRGIGGALLRHTFSEFYRRGHASIGLGVDAGSLTGATRLYEKAGMRIAQQLDVYEKELRPGVDLMIREVAG